MEFDIIFEFDLIDFCCIRFQFLDCIRFGFEFDIHVNVTAGIMSGVGKNWYYDILQICVGEHCLLIAIEPCTAAHPSVKDFLKRLFRDDSFVFVGFRINDFSDEYKDTDFKVLLDIPNPVDLKELAAREPRFVGLNFEKWGFEKLVKLVLDVEYERPTRIPIYAADHTCEYSDELVLWSSVDVFLIAKMGMVLLSV